MSKLTNPAAADALLSVPQASELARLTSAKGTPRTRRQDRRSGNKQTAEKRPSNAIGTLGANKDSILGAGQAGVGSKVRSTTAISYRDAANLLDAAAFAAAIGIPLNRFLTVHTEAGGATDALKARARLAKLMHDWVRSKGGRFAHVTVRESGEGKGEHFHMLLHVPAALRDGFNRRQARWLRLAGLRRARGVAYTRPIGRSYYYGGGDHLTAKRYADNLAEALGYLLKGTDSKAAHRLRLQRIKDGGALRGKRCFHSENIGRLARERSRWRVSAKQ